MGAALRMPSMIPTLLLMSSLAAPASAPATDTPAEVPALSNRFADFVTYGWIYH